jgi:hypothetical protein
VIVRGVDRDGREVRLGRGYISQGLRWRAQELATEELGPRLAIDVLRVRAKEVTQERFTSLDRELERRAAENLVEARSNGRVGRIDESTLVARLEHLESLRLAERRGPASWALTPGWQDQLRELGTRGDVLKQIHRAMSGDPARYRIVRPGESLDADGATEGKVRFGRVVSKGLKDELKGVFYAVIETPTGRAYHVSLDSRGAEGLRPGDVVSFTTKPETPVRPVDREIAEVARAREDVYTLERTPGGSPLPHASRLRELERLGLAVPVGPDRWKVSPDLVQELSERQGDTPVRHRLLIRKEVLSVQAQVRHPGPVWLDRLIVDSFAPYGFGAELRRAVERRREALRHMGIPPDDPGRSAKLREIERRTVGSERAAATGQRFLVDAPVVLRGRIEFVGPASARTSYAVVSDGERFIVLPATSDLRASSGTEVTVKRGARGRLLVQPAVHIDLGR